MSPSVVTTAQRRARLTNRHHLGRMGDDVATVTRDLVALHSSDPVTPFLSLVARIPGLAVADVEDALYGRRSMWRLHAMRRTLWVVAVEHAPVVMAAASTDVATAERRKLHRWLTDPPLPDGALVAEPGGDVQAWLAAIEDDVARVLADGRPRRTTELTVGVPALQTRLVVGSGRWTTDVPLSSRLLFLMAMDGRLVRGPSATWRSSQYQWAVPGTWFAQPVTPWDGSPAQARAVLARRWLGRFGPATTTDLKWWTGWTVRQTTAALDAVSAVQVATDDGPGWVLPDDLDNETAPDGPVATLLPALDPTTMGWKDRTFYLGDHGPRLFDRNGNAGPTVWLDGRVVGGWAQRPDGEVVIGLLQDIGAEGSRAVDDEAARLTTWLDGTVVTPRFRTPLERELSG